ncbi:MAG: Ig-like domain-containing protein [Archaeoglobaceae archaeon]
MKLIVLVLVVGLLFVGCSQPTNNSQPANESTPTVTGKPTVETPETVVGYPGSPISLPDAESSYPYQPTILRPEAENVSLDTNISLSYSEPPELLSLEVGPAVDVSHVEKEFVGDAAKYTFYLEEFLKPRTDYRVTVTAGSNNSIGNASWNFTTMSPEIDVFGPEYFTYNGSKSRICLKEYGLSYKFLEEEDMCPTTMERQEVQPGDLGVVVNGEVKNEYSKDYYVTLGAKVHYSDGRRLSILDKDPVPGVISLYLPSNESRQFRMHVDYDEDLKRIEILSGVKSEILPSEMELGKRVFMTLNKKEFSSGDTLKLTIHNHQPPLLGDEVTFGRKYVVEYWDDDGWRKVKWLSPGFWKLNEWVVKPYDSFTQSIELYPVREGKYRITKKVNDGMNLSQTFEVVNGTPRDEAPRASLPPQFWRELYNYCNKSLSEDVTKGTVKRKISQMIEEYGHEVDPQYETFIGYGTASLYVKHATQEFLDKWPKECHGVEIEINVYSWAIYGNNTPPNNTKT